MKPVFVAYYTVGTGYELEAEELITTLNEFSLEHDVVGVRNLGTWQKNTQFKAVFCAEMWEKYRGRPIVYVDSDARIRQNPELFNTLDCDVGVHFRQGRELMSGTVFFGPTNGARELIGEWSKQNSRNPKVWDQKNLHAAIRIKTPRVFNLPASYTQIFDMMRHHGKPVIEHMQASRRLKKKVNQAAMTPSATHQQTAEAITPKNLRYVYINMTKDTDRNQSFLKEFPGVDWWRFPGCEGGLMWGEIARGLGLLGDLRQSGKDRLPKPKWGTLGCSLSHIFCLKMATIADGIVLFPDDVTNTRSVNLTELVSEALTHRPPGVGWIKFKNQKPLYATGEGTIHHSGGHVFRKLATFDRSIRQGRNTGSAAVIILRDQAKSILAALPPLTSTPFDNEMQAIVDQVPGGCWEMMDTGIVHAEGHVSVRRLIDIS